VPGPEREPGNIEEKLTGISDRGGKQRRIAGFEFPQNGRRLAEERVKSRGDPANFRL